MYKLKRDSIYSIISLGLVAALTLSGCGLGTTSDSGNKGSMWESVGGETAENAEATEVSEAPASEETKEPSETYQMVTTGTPEEVGLNTNTLKLIDDMMEVQMDYGFSGAQLAVIKDGKLVIDKAWGVTNGYQAPSIDGEGNILSGAVVDKSSAPITTDTLFDLASNTKMFATNFAVQKLVSDGLLDINKKVSDYIPGFKDREGDEILGKTEIEVSDLLSHQAGFPADPGYHNSEAAMIKKYPELFCQNRDEIISKIIDTPLKYKPRTEREYSDVDYMLLGFIVENITGKRLDQYVKEEFYDKMGLTHVTFNPLQNGFTKDNCAATELNGNTRQGRFFYANVRTDTVWGEVHDEKAYYCMDGVSGHAGLFSNARELAMLCQVMLNGGGWGEEKFFDQSVIDMFTAPVDKDTLDWGLGWWLKDGNDDSGRTNYFGMESSIGTFGHTGWTGTITSIDPDQNLIIVYLSSPKNSPVIDRMKNGNDFVGNNVSMGSLGLTPQLIYEAFNSSNDESIDALLIEMVNQRIRSLEPHYDKYDEWPHVTDAVAWVDTLLRRAEERKSLELKNAGLKAAEELRNRVHENATSQKSLDIVDQRIPGIIDRFKTLDAFELSRTYGEFEIGVTSISEDNKSSACFPSACGDAIMANMIGQSMICYYVTEGHGSLDVKILDPTKVDGLRIFVNGYEVDCSQIRDNPYDDYHIDISKVTRSDKSNVVQVMGIDVLECEPESVVKVFLN